jgi:type II secretory pathway pseudopilin PulG
MTAWFFFEYEDEDRFAEDEDELSRKHQRLGSNASMCMESGRSGTSLPEVGVVLGVLMIAASLAVPAWFAWRAGQRVALARSDIRALAKAGNLYYQEYGQWPGHGAGGGADARFGLARPNAEVVNVLRAVGGAGNAGHSENSRRIAFLEAPAKVPGKSGINPSGEFVDPWGTPYQVAVDGDLDNNCDIPRSIHGKLAGVGFGAWSAGPDREPDTVDDIVSWKR